MKAAVYYGARDIRIEDVRDPTPGPGEVLVEVARNGICGSDLHTYVGSAAASLHVPGIVLGHEFAGTVRQLGDDVDGVTEGMQVAVAPIEWCGECWACTEGKPNLCRKLALYGGYRLPLHGGLAPLVAVSRRSVFPVPEGLGVVEAALTEPVAVAVLGAGPIGLGVLQSAVAAGATLTIVSEPSEARRAVARSCGATAVLDPRTDDLVTAVRDLTGQGVDVAFDTTGANAALDQGIGALRPHGSLVSVAQWGERAQVDMGRAMAKEINLRFSFTYEPAIDFPISLDLLASGAVDAPGMITDHISLDELVGRGLEELLHHSDRHVKILVDPA